MTWQRRWIPAAFALMVAMGACTSEPTPRQSTLPTSQGSVGSIGATYSQPLAHIHAAAIDTATGTLYAGTHEGIWSVSDSGTVSKVGRSSDDFMGFSIGAPNQWFASGHPGRGNNAPNPLGLIASPDQGATWTSISRSGVSDFHVLTAVGDTLAGYDGGGSLLLSKDGGKTWNKGSNIQPSALAFAGSALLAATRDGLQRSTDGGTTFTPVTNSPAAALLASAGGDAWCVDTQGELWSSTGAGSKWTKRGLVGRAYAVAATDTSMAYVLTSTEIRKIT